MESNQRYFVRFSAIAVVVFAQAAFADYQAAQDGSWCNSRGLTIARQLKDSHSYQSTNCMPADFGSDVDCCRGSSIPGEKASCAWLRTGTYATQLHRNEFLIAGMDDAAVADAIAAEEQAQAQNEPPHANILNLNPPISTGDDLGSGIAISNVALRSNSSALYGITYKIRNNSSKALVAFSVGFDIYWDMSLGTPLHASSTQDGWFLGSNALESHQEEQEVLSISAAPQNLARILRVKPVLDYVEFSDGTAYGARTTQLAKTFAESRQIKLNAQNHYAGLLRKGLSQGKLLEQLDEDLTKTNGIEHTALFQMRLDLVNHGSEYLASKVLESRSLPTLDIRSK